MAKDVAQHSHEKVRRVEDLVAGRSASHDLTGGIDRADNAQGLDDARRRLGQLSFRTH